MTLIFILSLAAIIAGGVFGRTLAASRFSIASDELKREQARAHSLPRFHGYLISWHIGIAALTLFLVRAFLPDVMTAPMLAGGIGAAALLAGVHGHRTIAPEVRSRVYVERYVRIALFLCSVVAVLTTFGIVFSLIFESARFFEKVSMLDFLTGLQWSPQTAIRADQAGQSGAFGAIPIFAGTFMIMAVAMLIATPIGLLIAIYLSEYASAKVRATVKPFIEILAGVPTVVYGFFALLTVGPAIRGLAESLGFSVPTQSAIAAGSVMGVMIIPFISSLSDDVINAIPQNLRDGAYALGATKSETMMQVIFPAALPGIMGAILLGVSRAIGETMIVVMAAGRAANLTGNPFEAVTTVTVQIVALLTGDQEFDSAKTLAAFALGLILFIITLILNIIALLIVRRYREQHE